MFSKLIALGSVLVRSISTISLETLFTNVATYVLLASISSATTLCGSWVSIFNLILRLIIFLYRFSGRSLPLPLVLLIKFPSNCEVV